jgi:hypothetical protein
MHRVGSMIMTVAAAPDEGDGEAPAMVWRREVTFS